MSALVELQSVTYAYAKSADAVLKSLTFSVPEKKLVALLGPNGSGKSTAFKVLSTQLHGWSGNILFAGQDLRRHEPQVRAQLGVCFQSPSLDRILTGRENLFLHARVLGLAKAKAAAEISSLAKKLQINYLDRRVAEMSGGQARRIEIIKAFLGAPRLLLLDEPTNGLDPQARRDFWTELRALATDKSATVLVTTHLIEEAELCEELIFMSEGECVGHGAPASLRAELGYEILQIDVTDADARIAELHTHLHAGEKTEVINGTVRIATPRAQSLFDALRDLWKNEIQRMEWAKPTLADVYFEKTGKALR